MKCLLIPRSNILAQELADLDMAWFFHFRRLDDCGWRLRPGIQIRLRLHLQECFALLVSRFNLLRDVSVVPKASESDLFPLKHQRASSFGRLTSGCLPGWCDRVSVGSDLPVLLTAAEEVVSRSPCLTV